jgi:type I restriction enzyme S subunit
MRGEVPKVPLSKLVRAHYGKALKQGERNSIGSAIVFGSSGAVGFHDEALFDYPSIVVGRKGSVGAVTFAPNGGWVIDTAYYLEVLSPTLLDLRYLFHALSAANLAKDTITTSIPGLNRDALLANQIVLPTLVEQQRIAAILDKADSLRRKRQEAIHLADGLLRSTLLTCLEQPYDAVVVEQLLSMNKNAIRTGPFGSQLLHAEFTESGVPVLGIDNVVTNRFRWDERRYISADKYEQLSRYTVYPGDVMVTIMGTTGRVAVAPDDLPICISTKHLCTMTVDRTKILPEFLWACLLWDPAVRAQSSRESKGAIMDGLNMGIVKGLLIKVPSMDVQQRFVSVLRKVDALRSKYKVAVDDGTSLNAALTSKLLAGSSQH